MKCSTCGADSEVIDSRETSDGRAVRRRRQCLGTGKHRWTTHEFETEKVTAYVPTKTKPAHVNR